MLFIHYPAASLAADDRAVFYGDGLFSTVAVQDSVALAWSYHHTRLFTDARRLGFPAWATDDLDQAVASLALSMQKGILKCILSRGSGGRGYLPPTAPNLQVYLYTYPFPVYPAFYQTQGVTLRLCQTRLAHQPLLAGMKHLNRLEQVLARQEWQDADVAEGLLCDYADNLIEGCMSNLFFIKNGVLCSPDLSRSGVAGIIRGRIIDLCAQWQIPLQISHYRLTDLISAQAVFVCNSVIGIWFVTQLVDHKQQQLQQWSTHPLLKRLQSALLTQQWIAS